MEGLLISRVRGVELRLNWSVLVVAALVTWSLAESLFPDQAEGSTVTTYWIVASITAVAFFLSLMAHELGHAMVALQEGVEVRRITLWLFGGIAELESEPETPRAALRIAAAGPAVSAVLGLSGVLLALAFGGLTRVAVMWFGVMNLLLLAFNLLPAFPLDGGRIYQARLWTKTRDRAAATERAANVGVGIGAVLVGLGVVQVLFGLLASGIWLMLLGWFLREAARAEWRHAAVDEPLSALHVSQVMTRDPVTVTSSITVQEFIAGVFFGGRHAAYPVVTEDKEIVGLIELKRLRAVAPADAETHTIGQLATPLRNVLVVEPSLPVATLLRQMTARGDSRALVMDDGELIGIVSPTDVARLASVVELAAPYRLERPTKTADKDTHRGAA